MTIQRIIIERRSNNALMVSTEGLREGDWERHTVRHMDLAAVIDGLLRTDVRERLRDERDEFATLLSEGVRRDFGTPGWRARAIKAGCLT